MIHKKCGTFIPDSECWYDVVGKIAKVEGYCPACDKRGFIGSIRLTDEQYNAWYHDMPLRKYRLAQVVNHSAWCA